MSCLRAVAGLSTLVLAACAAGPTPAPVTNLSGRTCSPAPDLASAQPLLLEKGKPVTVDLEAAACLELAEAGKAAYAAFRLPESSERYLVGIGSRALGETLFSPRALLLDGEGRTLREIDRATFRFHGAGLYAGIRARPEERFLVVLSDSSSIGRGVSHIAGATQVTTAAAGVGAFVQLHTGSETTHKLTFSHNGSLTVTAEPWPQTN